MVAEIISVGTELLLGQILNSDAKYLSVKLAGLGIDVLHQSVVGDNRNRLLESLALAVTRADIVITTGGLGPTQDDITKECVAEFCGEECFLNQNELDKIKRYFEKKGFEYMPNNDKQAMFPKNARILENRVGTAPGCIIEKDGKVFIVLPGPPSEMNPMFEKHVYGYLQKMCDDVIYTENIQIAGVGEAKGEYMIRELIAGQTNPTVATYCHPGYITVRITAKAKTQEEAKSLVAPYSREIKKIFKDKFFCHGDKTMCQAVGEFLIEKGITVSVSESCSGGLVSDALVSISGISAVYKFGAVTYSNEAKMNILGVKEETLNTVGAVSSETAMEMAKGVRLAGRSDIGVSTTGIAGPKSDDTNKPVGLVYIGLSTKDGEIFEELHLKGDRKTIRQTTVIKVFDMIRKNLMNKESKNGGKEK